MAGKMTTAIVDLYIPYFLLVPFTVTFFQVSIIKALVNQFFLSQYGIFMPRSNKKRTMKARHVGENYFSRKERKTKQ